MDREGIREIVVSAVAWLGLFGLMFMGFIIGGQAMWKCECCGEIFEQPDSERYCLEEYNGVSGLFGNRTYGYYDVCPECGSARIEKYYEESEETEWTD